MLKREREKDKQRLIIVGRGGDVDGTSDSHLIPPTFIVLESFPIPQRPAYCTSQIFIDVVHESLDQVFI